MKKVRVDNNISLHCAQKTTYEYINNVPCFVIRFENTASYLAYWINCAVTVMYSFIKDISRSFFLMKY